MGIASDPLEHRLDTIVLLSPASHLLKMHQLIIMDLDPAVAELTMYSRTASTGQDSCKK